MPDGRALRRFRAALLRWYARHGRDLPWRRTRDPYHVLLSEIMLQQTQVDRVVPKYHEFLARYPTLETLAAADVADVRRTWYPLGYNVRPIRLHAIAREAVARYGGRVPDDEQALLALKGIGRYTAGAVRVFAFGQRAPILDTNVRRVLGRVFHGTDGRRVPSAALWALAERVLPRRRVYDFNQALLDFGATWCTARKPRCQPCPMRRACRAYPWGAVPEGTRPSGRRRTPRRPAGSPRQAGAPRHPARTEWPSANRPGGPRGLRAAGSARGTAAPRPPRPD
jgi:A/G-specific adenine glycosylase